MSLAEIRMRLEDIVRFRLEPLVGVARASGLVPQPSVTIHFLENQLAYDRRRLDAARAAAKGASDALIMYGGERPAVTDTAATTSEEVLAVANDTAEAARRQPSHEEIAAAAYERYLTRGAADGQDYEDWLAAERELSERRGR